MILTGSADFVNIWSVKSRLIYNYPQISGGRFGLDLLINHLDRLQKRPATKIAMHKIKGFKGKLVRSFHISCHVFDSNGLRFGMAHKCACSKCIGRWPKTPHFLFSCLLMRYYSWMCFLSATYITLAKLNNNGGLLVQIVKIMKNR